VTSAPAGQPPLLNIANVLTGLRMVLVPFFLAALLVENGTNAQWRFIAFGIFVVAALTDRLDGELARRRGLVTAFGTIVDPIADKALMGSALVGLSLLGLVPWWATILIMGRELGVTMLRLWVLRHGIIPASRGGKAKTFVQSLAIGLFLLPLSDDLGIVEVLRWTTLAIAIALTVGTGLDYVLRGLRLRRTTAPAAESS
jgi:CDP-diacylglycerol---glycerol-3-phosphate 3-phosphatidyltransferase